MEKMEQIVAFQCRAVARHEDQRQRHGSPQMKKMYALGKGRIRAGPVDFAMSRPAAAKTAKRIRLLGPAKPHASMRAPPRGGVVARLSGCHNGRILDHAAPPLQRLLSAAAASPSHLRLGRYHRVVESIWQRRRTVAGDDPWNQALRRPR